MSSAHKNLSVTGNLPDASSMRFGIIVAEWNTEVTTALLEGAKATLAKAGAADQNIHIHFVPGSFELTLGAQFILESDKSVDAVICLGCVIQGETPHFDFICNAVANGISQLGMKYNKPVVFGVLTTLNLQQAIERAGGKHGNKGDEAAATAIKMVSLYKNTLK
jgi:6,7-dimethyl-8-ribityllumazine synthase